MAFTRRAAGASAACMTWSALAGVQGASIIRTHSVKETVHALTMLQLLKA